MAFFPVLRTALVWVLPWASPASANESAPAWEQRSLPNGMRVVVAPMASSPGVVAWQLWMGVGRRDEGRSEVGMARLVEHLLSEPAEAEALGVRQGAWTGPDETVFHALLPDNALPEYMQLRAAQITEPAPDDEAVARQLRIVAAERRLTEDDPARALDAVLRAAAFRSHPYGAESHLDVSAVPEAASVADFVARHHRPERAVLVVAGDVVPDEVHALAATAFGDWQAGRGPARVAAEPRQRERREVSVTWTAPTRARIAYAWKVAPHDADSVELAALDVAAELLTGPIPSAASTSPSGSLYERLVRTEGLATEVTARRVATLDPGWMRLELVLADEADPDQVDEVVREELAALAEVSGERVEAARTHLSRRRALALDAPAAVAEAIGWATRAGREVSASSLGETALAEVGADDVSAAAARWLVDAGLTMAILTSEAP